MKLNIRENLDYTKNAVSSRLKIFQNCVVYSLIPKYKPVSTSLKEKINFHVNSLMKELDEFCKPHKENIFFEFKLSNSRSVDMKPRLEHLLSIIGKNEIRRNFYNVIKCALTQKLATNYPLFELEDIVKCYNNTGKIDPYKVISKDYYNNYNYLLIQNIKNPDEYIPINQRLLLNLNPEYYIRFLIHSNSYNKQGYVINETTEEFKRYGSSDEYKIYQYIRNNKGNTIALNMQPRLKILLDIIGTDLLGNRIERYSSLIEKLPDDRLEICPVFESNNLVRIAPDNSNLYQVIFDQNPHTLKTIIIKDVSSAESKVMSQSELLRLNPEYFSVYIQKLIEYYNREKKLRKLGIKN